jgi:hypothetical protein
MQLRKSGVPAQYNFRPIVEPRPAYGSIVQAKAGCAHDVERNIRCSTKPGDVSRVGWNLRFNKCDANHLDRSDSLREDITALGFFAVEIQKERRDSLEVLVVPFERPCRPVEVVCASWRFLF